MSETINYSLFLSTSGDNAAGTDEDIYIQLAAEENGTVTSKTEPAYIDDPETDDFERNASKRYSFSASPIDYTHVYLALFPVGVKPNGDLWNGIEANPEQSKTIKTYKNTKAHEPDTWKDVTLESYMNGTGIFPSSMPEGAPLIGLDERIPSWKLAMFNLSGDYSDPAQKYDVPEFQTDQWFTRGTVLKIERHKFRALAETA